MIPVSIGIASFFIALLLHILVWRLIPGLASMRTLFRIFVVILTLFIVTAYSLGLLDIYELLYAATLYSAMMLTYLLTYIGVEYDSPTLSLVNTIQAAGPSGIEESALQDFIRQRPFVRSRLDQLYRDGFVHNKQGMLLLAVESSIMLRLCDFYRALMGRRTEGG